MDDLRKAMSDLKKCSSGMKKKRKDDEKTAKAELVVTLRKGGGPSPESDSGRAERPGHPRGFFTVAGKGKYTGKMPPKSTPAQIKQAKDRAFRGPKKSFEGIPDLSKSFSTDVVPLHIRNATESSPINALRRS